MIRFFLSTRSPFHVIAVTETWLSDKISSIPSLDDYTLYRRDRNRNGGGVALYVHHTLTASIISSSDGEWSGKPGKPEYLFCEVTAKGISPIFVGVVYRPPHSPFIQGSNFIEQLTTHMHNYSTKVIMGDFNADQLSSSEDANFIKAFIDENSLTSVPYGATHHRQDSDTWLDLCLIDEQDRLLSYWKTDTPFINGHDLITATLDVQIPRHVPNTYTYRNYKGICAEKLRDFLSACDWSSFATPSLDECITILNDNITKAINHLAPLKTVTPGRKRHPWFTTALRDLLTERNRLYRRFRRSRLPWDLYFYRIARDDAHKQVEEARLNYYYSRLSTLTDVAEIWRELENLGITTSKSSPPARFSPDALNEHFSSISNDPQAPPVEEYLRTLESLDLPEHFIFRAITESDVLAAVSHFNTQARGSDGIPQVVVSKALPILAPLICQIFNLSLSEACFPAAWKSSLVRSLNKINSPTAVTDYRPISLLCFLSKALEWLVHKQISEYLETRLYLDNFQTGFRTGHSTQSGLIKLTDDVRLGIDRKKVTLLLLFDFSKAFDTVCHVRLLGKLSSFGFSKQVIRWLASYLTGRKQAVIGDNSEISTFLPLNTGVPQGSVLGPLLFSLYINDIGFCLDSDVSHLIYADDLQIYSQCHLEELDSCSVRMAANAERIMGWAALNRLKLNATKTKAIVLGSPYYINALPSVANTFINIGGAQVNFESSVCNLGLVLDSKLSWKEHVTQICKRAHCLMYRLYFFRKSTSLRLRQHLVQALLFPIIDYCSLAYCDLTQELDLKLQRLVNTGIRYIYGVRRDEHISPYRRELQWLTTAGRRKYFMACFLRKMFKTSIPAYLIAYFDFHVALRPVRGEVTPLDIPSFKTETLRNSFFISASYLWNSLPSQLRDTPSTYHFKHAAKNYFFNLENS